MRTIVLLDVDGVLVYDRGYRAGVVATVEYFAAEIGLDGRALDSIAPTEEEIDAFHAAGYTNEWDLNPFVVGILWLAVAQGEPIQRPEYGDWAARSRAYSGRPSERALAVLVDALQDEPLLPHQRGQLEVKLKDLLADPYNVFRCPTTQVFQEFVLGSRLYADHYGLGPRTSTPSLLEREDKPALTAVGRESLERLVEQGAQLCIYTARPSGPPVHDAVLIEGLGTANAEAGPEAGGFPLAPEAELAIRLVGLEQVPLMASGRMEWLANRHGERAEALTKPSPVQVLAALGAAAGAEEAVLEAGASSARGGEAAALEAAYALYRGGQLLPPLTGLAAQPFQVFVLEDGTPGLEAAAKGVHLLKAHGSGEAQMRGVGVTRSPVKAATLEAYCETVVPDVNAGLAWIEGCLGGDG